MSLPIQSAEQSIVSILRHYRSSSQSNSSTSIRIITANPYGDCLQECRDDYLDCVDYCREYEPGDPDCYDDCSQERNDCDSDCLEQHG